MLAMFASIMDYATFSWTRDRLQIIPMMWDQKENYAFNGFTLAFALNLPMANVPAPAGYSAEAIGDIPGFPAASVPADKPDIIIVMSESFWDPTKLPGVTITPDPIPTVRETRSGSMFSPEFGGMTANIEFEALTGFSNAFLPYGSIPYQQYIHGAVPSLATFLQGEGYATRALHPFSEWFWNRSPVYQAFGFDRFLSEERMPPIAKRGPLASDAAFTEEIIRQADLMRKPFFFFAVTLQGHGPYEPEPLSRRHPQGRRAGERMGEGFDPVLYRGRLGCRPRAEAADGLGLEAQAQDRHRLLRRPSAAARPRLCRDGLHEGAGRKPQSADRRNVRRARDAACRLVEPRRHGQGHRRNQPGLHPAAGAESCRHHAIPITPASSARSTTASASSTATC